MQKVGEKLINAQLVISNDQTNIRSISLSDFCENKKVVLLGLPGAFTPICSARHIMQFAESLDDLKLKGVDEVAAILVNDPYVLSAWSDNMGIPNNLTLLSDGNAYWANKAGLSDNLENLSQGIRTKRFSMIVDNTVVTHLNVEANNDEFEVSNLQVILSQL